MFFQAVRKHTPESVIQRKHKVKAALTILKMSNDFAKVTKYHPFQLFAIQVKIIKPRIKQAKGSLGQFVRACLDSDRSTLFLHILP